MPLKKPQAMVMGLTAGVLFTVVAGSWLLSANAGSIAPPSTAGPAATTAPAPTVAATTSKPATSASAPAAQELVDWRPMRSGCKVEQTDAKIHIFGTNNADGWGHENGVQGSEEYPIQDFEISTEFMVPKFSGPGMATVILRAKESNFNQVTLQYFLQGNTYMLRWWTNSGEQFANTQLPKFGDEDKAYHRMRLKYDAATHQSTGWIDDKLVGTLNFEFKDNVRFVLGASTDKKGNDIDLYFDHTKLTLGGETTVPSDKIP